jgi:hypothetical protein
MATVADLNRAAAGRRWSNARWDGAGPTARAWARIRCRAEQVAGLVRTPTAVRATAPLEPGERILAFAHNLDGRLVVATERALRHQAAGAWSRLGWEQVSRITWDDDRRTLAVTDTRSGRVTKIVLHATDGNRIADLGQERIGWTFLLSTLVPLAGHPPARVAARRQPGTGQIIWQVSLSNGSGPRDPELYSEITTAIAELRAQVEV